MRQCGRRRMQTFGPKEMEIVERLTPAQPGGDQDALHKRLGERVNELHTRAAILHRFTELGCKQTVPVA